MRLSCSSIALLLLCGGEGDGDFDEFDIAMAFVLEKKKEEDERRMHSCIKNLFYKQLGWAEKAKQLRYVPRLLLVKISSLPWWKLLLSGEESALITMA
eukprot:4662603-Ditylum_brightwellii.AAC.1